LHRGVTPINANLDAAILKASFSDRDIGLLNPQRLSLRSFNTR
jgi:hypothetical protein